MKVQKWVILTFLQFLFAALPLPSAAQMQTSGEVIGTGHRPLRCSGTRRDRDPGGCRNRPIPASDDRFVGKLCVSFSRSRHLRSLDSGQRLRRRYRQRNDRDSSVSRLLSLSQLTLSGAIQEVTVSGAIPLVQTTTSDVGGVLDRKEIESLPLKNRDFTDLALLVPQIVRTPPLDPTKTRIGEISVAGTGGRQSNIFVDGFEDYDFVVGGVGYDVSPEGIQEFHVVTNNFSAEQARSVGAVVNMIERTGTNDIHGDAFYFFRNQALTARDFFQKERAHIAASSKGGTLGGPPKT